MKKGYVALWLLLALALSIVTLISFYEEDITIGNYTLKKAPIVEMLGRSKEKELADSIQRQEKLDSIRTAKEVEKVDSMPQSIFIFGDSMTYNLALRLAKYARQNGHTIHSVNWDSSSTLTWGQCDTLAYYIRKYKPTQIFIALGSNELYLKNLKAREPYIRHILEMIDTIPYVWIGPPNWKADAGINDEIEAMCAPRSFFRSAGMEFKRKADHIHPTAVSSALWMDSIMRWLPKSSHPFLATPPADSIRKANPNIIFLKPKNK